MALCRKVNNPVNIVVGEHLLDGWKIADVGFYKYIVWFAFNIFKVCQIACVGEFVEIDDAVIGVFVHKKTYHVRPDKTSATSNYYVAFDITHCLCPVV